MKIGMNLLLWTPFVTEEHFGILKKLKATGFDGVEVPLFGGDVKHYKKVAKAIKDNGLGCTTCTVMPDAEHNPISADAKSRQGAVEYLKWVIDCNSGPRLGGPGRTVLPALGREALQRQGTDPRGEGAGRRGASHDRRLCPEGGRRAGHRVPEPLRVLFPQHARRWRRACQAWSITRTSASCTIRSTPTSRRRTPWDASSGAWRCSGTSTSPRTTAVRRARDMCRSAKIFKALRAGGYDRWLTIEAFGTSLPELAATTCVWRELSASPEECYSSATRRSEEGWDAAA